MQEELTHRSFFDVLKENLAQEERRNYIHRFMYFGRHSFSEGANSIRDLFEKTIKDVNSKYYDEEITGALVHYPKHFIHIVEGSENTIFEHIENIFAKEGVREKFGTVKVLMSWHHIRERYFVDWFCVTAVPPTLLEEVHPESSNEETENIMKMCINKVTKLADLLVTQIVNTTDKAIQNISSKAHDLLPEYAVLESLLDLPSLMDIDRYAGLYIKVEESIPHQECVWPTPSEFVPYDVYDVPYQPRELKEKDTQDAAGSSLPPQRPQQPEEPEEPEFF